MLRFAPSPTEDLHIESLRIALFNYILSVQKKEDFIIRMEDIDKERNIEGKDDEIIGLLDLFGIKHKNVIYQSANLKYHRAMAIQLLHEKIAFNCFCTPSTLETKKKQAEKENRVYLYDDACLSLLPEDTIDNESPFSVRLRMPTVDINFSDKVQGEMCFSPGDLDNFIILSTDKKPTYNFACAVDDMIADISTVIRTDDHVTDTPKQIAVRAALNYTKEIEYAHVPAIVNSKGEALSSHEEMANVKKLLEEGFLPEAIINYLISMGNKPPQELFSLEEACQWFDLESMSKASPGFDIEALRQVNREHLKVLDDVELSRYVGFADADIGKLAKLYLDEVSTTKGLKGKIAAIFSHKTLPEDMNNTLDIMKSAIQTASYFDTFDAFKTYIMKETGLKEEDFDKGLRLLFTGCEDGPELSDIYAYLKNYLPEIIK